MFTGIPMQNPIFIIPTKSANEALMLVMVMHTQLFPLSNEGRRCFDWNVNRLVFVVVLVMMRCFLQPFFSSPPRFLLPRPRRSTEFLEFTDGALRLSFCRLRRYKTAKVKNNLGQLCVDISLLMWIDHTSLVICCDSNKVCCISVDAAWEMPPRTLTQYIRFS